MSLSENQNVFLPNRLPKFYGISACWGQGQVQWYTATGQAWVSWAHLGRSGSGIGCSPHNGQFSCSMGLERIDIYVHVAEASSHSYYILSNTIKPSCPFAFVNILRTGCITIRYCSLSLWRVARGSKLMFLELIHGLFIT